jgi:hypothetical protein
VTVDNDKQLVVLAREDVLGLEVAMDDVELVQQDRRAYAARVQARIELRQRELLDTHGVPRGLFPTLRLLKDPVRCQEILDLLRRVDVNAIETALVKIDDEEHDLALRPCVRCHAVIQPDDPKFPSMYPYGGLICGACEHARLTAPSRPPRSGLQSALARARRARLPATLTDAEWARTIAFFRDRCALCSGAWCLVEHATPIELGGGTTIGNCLPACVSCNVRKGKRALDALGTREFDPVRLDRAKQWLQEQTR